MRSRTPSLSNASQVELMSAVKKDRLNVEAAIALAQTLEEVSCGAIF